MSRRQVPARRLLPAGAVLLAVLGLSLVAALLVDPFPDGAVRTVRVQAPAATAQVSVVNAERQSAILAAEDRRLLTLVGSVRPGSAPYVEDVDGSQTLVLTAGGLPYGLPDLIGLGAAQHEADGSVLLTRHVFVAPGATLAISAPGTALRLASNHSGFVSLVAWKANLLLAGEEGRQLAVTGWDADEQLADATTVDGRAYVRAVGGDMQLRHVDLAHLGFWSGRTSGAAWTGSSRATVTGAAIGSSFRHNHYGAFASEGRGITVTDSEFSANAVDGLSLHRSTAGTTVARSAARGNGRHGFSADQGSESLDLTEVVAEGNAEHGVLFSGTPLSDGRSASGVSPRAYGQLHVAGGEFRRNGKAGIRVVDGNDVAITGTRVADNSDGIVLVGTTVPTTIRRTTVTGSHRFGVSVSDGAATVADNKLSGSETAIRVRDAAVAVTGNHVREATGHAISVVGASAGSTLSDNTIGGRGPSGLDLYRVDAGVDVELSGNDVEGWTRDRDDLTYWSTFIPNHPMLILWVLVLGAPLLLTARARRRLRPAPGTKPYGDDIRRQWTPPVRVVTGRRLPSEQL